jgi:signal transduction histidine kinase
MKLRFLHLEDSEDDAELVRRILTREGIDCDILAVGSRAAYRAALQQAHFDAVLSDSSVSGYDGGEALSDARERFPGIPFIVVSAGPALVHQQLPTQAGGATARVPKSELHLLGPTIKNLLSARATAQQPTSPVTADTGSSATGSMQQPVPAAGSLAHRSVAHHSLSGPMGQLISVVQQLSLARDLPTIMDIVRRAARVLVNADGATFVLREGDRCFYAEEDAIAPLWKGQRFPLQACISGWAMLNRKPAIIEDIYLDSRIPHDAYRATFVKSLVMTPIRTVAPIGAIGVYWATQHLATETETLILQALADSTSIAIEAADVFTNLERKVAERTAELDRRNSELQVLNKELEAFSYSVAHDLRSPLITIDGFTQVLLENTTAGLDEPNRKHLERISTAVRRAHRLINDLLDLSKIVRAPIHIATVDLSRLAREILQTLSDSAPTRVAEFVVADGVIVQGDPGLLRVVLENLLSNAWKFSSRQERTHIEFGSGVDRTGRTIYFVRDNGAGFDPRYAAKLFSPFQRLHSETQFPGTGVGLATVQRIIHRHGGEVWAESAVDCGAGFYFTLPRS